MSTPFPTGGVIFPLPGQLGQNPNIPQDDVSVYVDFARIPKSSGLFKSDTTLGLSFKVEANYRIANATYGDSYSLITVTKAYSFDVKRDADGNVVLPLLSKAVVDTCPLMLVRGSDKAFLSNLDINLTFLATRSSTGFSIALQEIFKLSSKMPIPNPYTPYVNLLGEGISNVVQTVQSQDANPQPLASMGLQFVNPGATLSGYYVLLMSTDQQIGNGYVDVNNLQPTQLGYNPVSGLTYNGSACKNANVVFRVAYKASPFPKAISAEDAANLHQVRGLLASTGLTEKLFLKEFRDRSLKEAKRS